MASPVLLDELDELLDGLELDGFELEELLGLLLELLDGVELDGTLELGLLLKLELGVEELDAEELEGLLEELELGFELDELLDVLELPELLVELLGTTQQHGNQPIIHTPLE